MRPEITPRALSDAAANEAGVADSATWITRIGAQTALLTALLFYFGWVRTSATYGYFGVDLSLLDFSTSDLVLRSVSAVYQPLLILGLAVLAFAFAQEALVSTEFSASYPNAVSAVRRGAIIGGLVLTGVAIVGIAAGLAGFWLLMALTTGLAFLRYAISREPDVAGPPTEGGIPTVVLTALLVLASFWTVSLFAERVGASRGEALARDLDSRTSVVVYARSPLSIAGSGIEQVELDRGTHKWRYAGLRLLVRNGKRYFLVPSRWLQSRSRVYVLPEDDTVRFEIVAP